MAVTLSERNQPDRFDALHWLGYMLPDGRAFPMVSGDALVNYGGGAPDFTRETFILSVRIDRAMSLLQLPPAPDGFYNALRLNQWVVFASPNAMNNDDANAGYAVDRFFLTGNLNAPVYDSLGVRVDVAARNSNGWLYRVGYHVTMIAQVVQERVPG